MLLVGFRADCRFIPELGRDSRCDGYGMSQLAKTTRFWQPLNSKKPRQEVLSWLSVRIADHPDGTPWHLSPSGVLGHVAMRRSCSGLLIGRVDPRHRGKHKQNTDLEASK